MHDNMTDFLDPLLSHSTLVQACGNGHTHPHTFLVFYPLRNLEEGVRSISALHTSFPPSLHSFSISSFYVIFLLPRLPCALPSFFLPLFLTSSPPYSFLSPFHSMPLSPPPPDCSIFPFLPLLSVSAFLLPLPPPLLFPPVLLRVSLSYPFASNSPSLSCSLLASLCNNKLRTNSMYISLFSPAR